MSGIQNALSMKCPSIKCPINEFIIYKFVIYEMSIDEMPQHLDIDVQKYACSAKWYYGICQNVNRKNELYK